MPKYGERESCRDLVGAAGQHQEPEDEGERGARQHAAQGREQEVAGVGGDREAELRRP